jgi:hypothetical protein
MDGGFVSSDAGTLLILDEEDNDKKYPVRFCTPEYCSIPFKNAFKDNI